MEHLLCDKKMIGAPVSAPPKPTDHSHRSRHRLLPLEQAPRKEGAVGCRYTQLLTPVNGGFASTS